MRGYWTRIALGALAIFIVGMVGVSLARRSIGGVRQVAEGSGPITIPVAFVPFKLDGHKLGTLNRLVLHREAPKRLSSVELGVKLSDSVLARGLEGCRLVANIDAKDNPNGFEVGPGSLSTGVFSCLHGNDTTSQFQEFGHAVFQPGDVSVPLLLPNDIVDDLRSGDDDSDFGRGYEESLEAAEAAAEAAADSAADEADARADSISEAVEAQAASSASRTRRLIDSLRGEGIRRADSARLAVSRVADSGRSR
jgi:hypothetical protein